MKEKENTQNTKKKSILVKLIIVVAVAALTYYAVSGILSGMRQAVTE